MRWFHDKRVDRTLRKEQRQAVSPSRVWLSPLGPRKQSVAASKIQQLMPWFQDKRVDRTLRKEQRSLLLLVLPKQL